MSEMIDRVAEAIYGKPTQFDGDVIGTHLSMSMVIDASSGTAEQSREFVMSICRDAAIAAIEAMKPTTTSMDAAGAIYLRGHISDASGCFETMIDAALKEQTK